MPLWVRGKTRKSRRFIGRNLRYLLIAAALLLASPVWAQSPLAKLLGHVGGRSAEDLSGARVQVTREDYPPLVFHAVTDARGEFRLAGLPPGSYAVEIRSPGLEPYRQSHLELRGGTTLEINATLLPPGRQPPAIHPPPRPLEWDVEWGTQFAAFSRDKLPRARNIWARLESEEPSTVTNRVDVGGLETGIPALVGALGASWTENRYHLNGFDLTDPYLPGRPLIDPDWDDLAEFQVVAGAKPAEFASSGVVLALATQPAPESFRGAARLFYSGRGTESNNLDARLQAFGFPGPERLRHLVEGNVQLGGKLPPAMAHWPVFVSLATQQLAKSLGGFGAPIDIHVYRALAELTPISRGTQRLDLLYGGQHIFNSREGAAPRIDPSATTRGNDNFHQFQGRWSRTLGPAGVFGLGFGAVHAIVSSGIQPGLQEPSTLNLPLMTRRGPAPLSTAGLRSQYQLSSYLGMLRGGFAGNHSLDLGADWERSYISNRWDAFGGIEQVLVGGIGEEVIRWNTPTEARQHVQNVALYAQDAWRPARWLRVPFGLRLETSSGRARGAAHGIRWTTLQPRTGVVVPLTRHGPVLRASWSRYAHLLQGRYLDFGNPAALGEQVFSWHDLNGDTLAQPQEIGPRIEVSGGPYSNVDRGLARPFTDEISAGLEQVFAARFRAGVRFFRRDDHRLIGLANRGVPFSSYTPVSVLDPGNDGIAGTADDQILTLYNRNPAALGRDFFLLTNPPGDRGLSEGLEIRLVKQLVRRWDFSASFTAMRTQAPTSPGNSVLANDTGFVGSLYNDPNTLLYATSRTYFDRAFVGKATGYYLAPRGFEVAAVAKYYDGLPFGRLLFVNGFNQGPFFVRTTPRGHPGGFQTQFNATLDLRVSRAWALARGVLSGYLDCFNVLNVNRNTLEADLTGPTFQSRVPLAVESPRVVRLGLEWKF